MHEGILLRKYQIILETLIETKYSGLLSNFGLFLLEFDQKHFSWVCFYDETYCSVL